MDTRHGYVVVDGIPVYWDEDRDERVVPVVKALKAALDCQGLPNVVRAVQEHEGTLIVDLQPFCRFWSGLKQLIERLVTNLTDLILLDPWTTKFVGE